MQKILLLAAVTIIFGFGCAPKTAVQSNNNSVEISKNAKSLKSYIETYTEKPLERNTFDSRLYTPVFEIITNYECDPAYDDFCSPETKTNSTSLILLSDSNWADGKEHEFYFEYQTEGPPSYYGPFYDNTVRLNQEYLVGKNK